MIYYRLLLSSTIIFIFLAATTIVVISQSSTRQVGVPMCQIYTEASGRKCARMRCDWSQYTISNPNPNDPNAGCTPTHPRDQNDIHCENSIGCRLLIP